MWSKPFRDLIDNPAVLPVLQELLGEPKWGHAHPALPEELRPRIRLDHDNIHFRPGTNPDGGGSLHTGYSGPDCREPFPTPIARLQETLRSAAQGC